MNGFLAQLKDASQRLTVKDLCKVLQISRPTAYGMIHSGKLQAIMHAGKWVTTRGAVETMLSANLNKRQVNIDLPAYTYASLEHKTGVNAVFNDPTHRWQKPPHGPNPEMG